MISLDVPIVLCVQQGFEHARTVYLTFESTVSLPVCQVLQRTVLLLCNPDDLDPKLREKQWTSSVLSVKCWDSTIKYATANSDVIIFTL
jgi:hypothetical protein